MNEQAPETEYDAVIVGARCAGATLATRLARAGWRVALVDRSRFPSDTVSTHVLFPDALHELESIRALDRLRAKHTLAPVRYSWRVLGQEVAGTFTPIGDHDRCLSVRRIALDVVLVDLAVEAGASLLEGHRVRDLVGTGSAEDPVRGVVLEDGRRLLAPWVIGADGQNSTVARRLGLAATKRMRGEFAMLLGYWKGLPPSDWCRIDVHERAALMSVPVEDGLHLLSVSGAVDITRGGVEERATRYHHLLRQFPGVLNPRLLADAELVSGVVAVPETMLRGFHRTAAGPGWALVGDAGHLKHPSTAQGITDAIHQSRHLADALVSGGDLSGYERWRDARAAGHDEWSFAAAQFPTPAAAGLYAGIAADRPAAQQFLDTFTKRTTISEVITPERSARWRAASAYEDGLRRVRSIARDLDEAALGQTVPACPEWSVRDLLAHLTGVAEDSARGGFFAGATGAWADTAVAAERERWTAGHVAARGNLELGRLVDDLEREGLELVRALRSGDGPAGRVPTWMFGAPAADLAVHLGDLRETLGIASEPDTPIWSFAFAQYRRWLRARLEDRSLPSLLLTDGDSEWAVGRGEPEATVHADRDELFRMISGRRSEARIRALRWSGDPAPYLPVISPYPLPA